MTASDLVVEKSELDNVRLIEPLDAEVTLAPGQVLVEVERFGLTANNISYAAAGERMGYWAFFPAPEPGWGRVPAWGYGVVVRSDHPDVPVGERLFGFVPMSRRFVMAPTDVDEAWFTDSFEHRADLHPWYNRYYRTAADPVSRAGFEELQPVLWALFMTGWELANDFIENENHGAASVVVASASSKTAFSFAHSLSAAGTGIEIVGLTSAMNADPVRNMGCYDTVMTYDALDLDQVSGATAFVDMAGNAALSADVHNTFGERLTKSYRVGGTHRTARGGDETAAGPEPEFFFIPNVAEERAGVAGHAEYHDRFAAAWAAFAPWVAGWIDIRTATGPAAIEAAYLDALTSGARPTEAVLLSFD